MKQAYFLAGVLAVYLPGVAAVEFNTDALKSMQEEGHKMIAQEKDLRSYKLPTGLCLQAGGGSGKSVNSLVINTCDSKSGNQKWRIDDKGRLLNQGGSCVGVADDAGKSGASAIMQPCSTARFQQWKRDGRKRLVNGLNKCLQATGDGRTAGANVVTTGCNESPGQVWN